MRLNAKGKKYLIILLPVAILVMAFYNGYNLYVLSQQLPVLATSLSESAEQTLKRELEGDQPLEPATFLLFGIDAGEFIGGRFREGEGNADTIVLAKVYPATQRLALLSIPRDTLVEIPGYTGFDKINHAHRFGGAELLVKTVAGFTGVEVDYYVGLNYLAFIDIVDLLGGVEFEVDRLIVSNSYRIEPGVQLLDGNHAFVVITTRRDPMGDVDRAARQQRFIQAVAAEIKDRPLDEILFITLATWENLDTNLDLVEGIRLYRKFEGVSDSELNMELVPGRFINREGITYWQPNQDGTEKVIEELFKAGKSGDVNRDE